MTDRAVYLSPHDERMIFVIPWHGFSLVGTTDTDFDGDPDRLWATREEVTYLLDEVAKVLPDKRATFENVAYTYAGVRPLSFEPGRSASAVSREHRVIPEGPEGRFLSVTGTKLTCFRSLAEDVGDRVMRVLGRGGPRAPRAPCSTAPTRRPARSRCARGWTCRKKWRRPGLPCDAQDAGGDLRSAFRACSSWGASCPTASSASARAIPRSWPSSTTRCGRSWRCRCRTCCCGAPASARAAARASTARSPSRARMAELAGWTPRRLDAELEAYSQHVELSRRFRHR